MLHYNDLLGPKVGAHIYLSQAKQVKRRIIETVWATQHSCQGGLQTLWKWYLISLEKYVESPYQPLLLDPILLCQIFLLPKVQPVDVKLWACPVI